MVEKLDAFSAFDSHLCPERQKKKVLLTEKNVCAIYGDGGIDKSIGHNKVARSIKRYFDMEDGGKNKQGVERRSQDVVQMLHKSDINFVRLEPLQGVRA